MNTGWSGHSNGWRFQQRKPIRIRIASMRGDRPGPSWPPDAAAPTSRVGFHGTVTSQSSPMGVMFAQIGFRPSNNSVRTTEPRGDESNLMLAPLDGDARLDDGERSLRMAGGDCHRFRRRRFYHEAATRSFPADRGAGEEGCVQR